MEKLFEDCFSECQADMVSICLEYVEEQADMIYVYCSHEGKTIHGDFFFTISGETVKKHQLNEISNKQHFEYDISEYRQDGALDIIIEDIDKIKTLCKQYNRDMPTQIKLIYDVNKNSLKATYSYENFWSDSKTKISPDIFNEWFEEIKNNNM